MRLTKGCLEHWWLLLMLCELGWPCWSWCWRLPLLHLTEVCVKHWWLLLLLLRGGLIRCRGNILWDLMLPTEGVPRGCGWSRCCRSGAEVKQIVCWCGSILNRNFHHCCPGRGSGCTN